MKMRTIIEAGRKASPLVNQMLDAIAMRIERCRTINEDASLVKSGESRAAMSAECAHELDDLTSEFGELVCAWKNFDSALGEYKYKFRGPKKRVQKDLPGQQTFFDES